MYSNGRLDNATPRSVEVDLNAFCLVAIDLSAETIEDNRFALADPEYCEPERCGDRT